MCCAVYLPGARLELTDKAIVQTVKVCFQSVRQILICQTSPYAYRGIFNKWLSYATEPTHESRQSQSRYTVGEQKVQVFIGTYFLKYFTNSHHFLTQSSYKGGFEKEIIDGDIQYVDSDRHCIGMWTVAQEVASTFATFDGQTPVSRRSFAHV